MDWKADDQCDILFLREVLVSDIYKTRKGSPERRHVWDGIATKLNSLSNPKFHVNKRSLRDRLNLLMSKFKTKTRNEEKASGISPEIDEIDVLLEELCEKEKDAVSTSTNSAKKKDKEDKATAEDMRLKAMESMGESQKRTSDSTEAPAKKSRKSIGDAVGYLKEKSNQEMALRKEELEIKKQQEARSANLVHMQQDMLKVIQQQNQDQLKQQQDQQKQQERLQQQQLQTMQSMIAQQQQQSQVMLDLFARFAPKQN